MSEIVAVLVLPAEGDPAGLLADGPCHASPPVVCVGLPERDAESVIAWEHLSDEEGSALRGWHPRSTYDRSDDTSALALWWADALAPEGWDRLRRAMPHHALPAHPEAGNVRWAAIVAKGLGLASRVVYLTRDASGALVEVSS